MTHYHFLYLGLIGSGDVHLMTQADTICISVHSQRYDTLKIHMKQVSMRCDTIQHNAIRCNGENVITFNASRPVS